MEPKSSYGEDALIPELPPTSTDYQIPRGFYFTHFLRYPRAGCETASPEFFFLVATCGRSGSEAAGISAKSILPPPALGSWPTFGILSRPASRGSLLGPAARFSVSFFGTPGPRRAATSARRQKSPPPKPDAPSPSPASLDRP